MNKNILKLGLGLSLMLSGIVIYITEVIMTSEVQWQQQDVLVRLFRDYIVIALIAVGFIMSLHSYSHIRSQKQDDTRGH